MVPIPEPEPGPDFEPEPEPDASPLLWLIALLAVGVVIFLCEVTAHSAPPEPWGRMDSPSGCTFGVVSATREHGVWCVTCRHCVSRSGTRVELHFWQDGREGPEVTGYCVRSHPRADCSLLWCDARQFRELPLATPLADRVPLNGQPVISVGSFASGTRTPALQTTYVTRTSPDGYEITLREWPWGGHSGGPVVDARTGRLFGVVATRNGTRTGKHSGVVGLRALYELVYGH